MRSHLRESRRLVTSMRYLCALLSSSSADASGSSAPRLTAFVFSALLFSASHGVQAADLRVMKTGLGDGTISTVGPATGIDCGTDCNESFANDVNVTLNISFVRPDSEFKAWGGDCATITVTPPATPTCTVPMDAIRSVRAEFVRKVKIPQMTKEELTPERISTFLNDGSDGNPSGPGANIGTPAEFVAALPGDFLENWILMPRSESLQTGTALLPRILLVSADGTKAFTLGLGTHTSYPGSHPDAIEYMQWDPATRNFRFHEIVVADVEGLDLIAEPGEFRFKRRSRGVSPDDQKCFACHSTQNIKHNGGTPGTTGLNPGDIKFKSKPNWDTYDSWGGMLGFNRDRIYKGSVEAAAFRKLLNLWTWQENDLVRPIIDQLALQPEGVRPKDVITRWDTPATEGGENDGHIEFNSLDPDFPEVDELEPLPEDDTSITNPTVNYSFDRRAGTGVGSVVVRNRDFITLQHADEVVRFGQDEGRGVNFFNRLYLGLNPVRVADEMIPPEGSTSTYATGNVPIDVRPIALAIANKCIKTNGLEGIDETQTIDTHASLAGVLPDSVREFFDARNGMDFNDVYDDTRRRAQSMPRRKADIQKLTLNREDDMYVYNNGDTDPAGGLILVYGGLTAGIVPSIPMEDADDTLMRQLRQEVFRRPIDVGHPDETVMGGIIVDREDDSTDGTSDNTAPVALYRYFLEPLGISVDKWSMGVRGRSRTYSFADQFNNEQSYTKSFNTILRESLGLPAGPTGTAICASLKPLLEAEFNASRLPGAEDPPTYTDIQRMLNKSCIECHGGLNYPPVRGRTNLDFSEDDKGHLPEADPSRRRLWRSFSTMRGLVSAPSCLITDPVCDMASAEDVSNSELFQYITDRGRLEHPYNPTKSYAGDPDDPSDPDVADERCPEGLMPCGGPPLSKTDIMSFSRWIIGGRPNTEGDPHIRTVDGTHYDFQSAGEFVLLRGEGMEIQARQTAVTTAGPLRPDSHTGLRSCVSVNTAIAMRVGEHTVSYQPEITRESGNDIPSISKQSKEPRRLILRVDGKPQTLNGKEITLPKGGRIVPTEDAEGIEVYFPGGSSVTVTPGWWSPHQIWYMNIGVNHGRAINGVMGAIAPGNWLPALANGEFLGPKPSGLAQRHKDLYETFADSWRVNTATSLFHYEAGLTPASFVVEGWPVSEPQSCPAPPQPGGPTTVLPAPEPIELTEAEQLCSEVADTNRRENCIEDVSATGWRGFADTYLQSQNLERRKMPAPAQLGRPENNALLPAGRVDFEWNPVPGAEAIDVVYRHCVWSSDERFDLNQCLTLGLDSNPIIDWLPPSLEKQLSPTVCYLLLLFIVILIVLLIARYKYKAIPFVILLGLAIIAIFALLNQHQAVDPGGSTSIADLEAGKIYYWKVVAITDSGIAVESMTNQFEIEK